MFYAKHPTLGNRHFESVDRAAMEADGWVFWPHGSGMPAYLEPGEIVVTTHEEISVVDFLPAKRKPGRPKKSA